MMDYKCQSPQEDQALMISSILEANNEVADNGDWTKMMSPGCINKLNLNEKPAYDTALKFYSSTAKNTVDLF